MKTHVIGKVGFIDNKPENQGNVHYIKPIKGHTKYKIQKIQKAKILRVSFVLSQLGFWIAVFFLLFVLGDILNVPINDVFV